MVLSRARFTRILVEVRRFGLDLGSLRGRGGGGGGRSVNKQILERG